MPRLRRWANTRLTRRHLRLLSGLTLFAYLAGHLLNHALGLVSIAAAEAGLRVAVWFWQSGPGTVALYGAATVHVALALVAVYDHGARRRPGTELVRFGLGLSMPTLLIGHAVSTRLAFAMYGQPPDYAHVVWMLWHSGRQGWQLALLLPGWAHGCLGLKLAFGRREWFRRWRRGLLVVALLLPAAAILGFLSMVREVSLLAQDPSWVAATAAAIGQAQNQALAHWRDRMLSGYLGAIGAVLAARFLRGFFRSPEAA